MASFRERLREIQTDLEATECRRVPLDDAALGLRDESERCRHLRVLAT